MIKRSLLAASLLFGASLCASDYRYEITPLVGGVFPEGNLHLNEQFLVGGELQINNLGGAIKPELQYLYSLTSDYQGNDATTSISRLGLNGVYEMEMTGEITPFVKAGIGYEFLYKHYYENLDSPYLSAGAGFKIPLMEQLDFKLEALYMLKHNDARYDSNLAVMAGLTYAFCSDDVSKPVETVSSEPDAPVAVTTLAAASAATVKVTDSDNDGINDADDRCPNTLPNTKVDATGCQMMQLNIGFENDSARIAESYNAEISKYCDFLKSHDFGKVIIIGHTDDRGSELYNLKLSKKRAEALRTIMVANGVAEDRIVVSGKGESAPVATNENEEGRQQNRTLEIVLEP